MSKVTVPSEIGQQLAAIEGCVELCDDSGRTIGYFTPALGSLEEPNVSDDEYARRANETPLYTTEQVLAHLRTL